MPFSTLERRSSEATDVRVVGLTGGMGAGKTVVSSILRSMGWPVYDADRSAKRLYEENGALLANVVEAFGEGVLDPQGKLDRSALGKRVFGDSMALERLNALVHPAVKSDFDKWFGREIRSGSKVVFRESAILFESGIHHGCHDVWMVDAPMALRKARIRRRNGWSDEEMEARLAHQWPPEELRSRADHIILNDGDTALVPQVVNLCRELS